MSGHLQLGRHHGLKFCFGVAIAAFLFPGCSRDPLARQPVSGAVTLNSQPLEEGAIHFVPVGGGGHPSGAPITKGRYHVPREQGLPPGEYIVRIFSSSGQRPSNNDDPGAAPPEPKDLIPAKYNVKSDERRIVKSDEKNEFDFEITTK